MIRPSWLLRAFTLLELLVVVAVIGLLLAILMPALSAATEAGRGALCATHLNQLFHGAHAYTEEHDERLPYYGFMFGRPLEQEWWPTQIARTMDVYEPDIYVCPSDPLFFLLPIYLHNGMPYMADGHRGIGQRFSLDQATWPANARYAPLKVSYRGSCDMTEFYPDSVGQSDPGSYRPRKITEWDRPSQGMHLIEGIPRLTDSTTPLAQRACFMFASNLGYLAGFPQLRTPDKNATTWQRHFGASNVLFIDGHVTMHAPIDVGMLAVNQEVRQGTGPF